MIPASIAAAYHCQASGTFICHIALNKSIQRVPQTGIIIGDRHVGSRGIAAQTR
jgi:hypothetical protein